MKELQYIRYRLWLLEKNGIFFRKNGIFLKTLKHLTATTCLHVYFVFLGCHSETEKGCYSPDANTKRAHLPIRQVSEWAKLWQQ